MKLKKKTTWKIFAIGGGVIILKVKCELLSTASACGTAGSVSPGRNLKTGLPEYEAVLTIRLRESY
jgi:hypothetical protein